MIEHWLNDEFMSNTKKFKVELKETLSKQFETIKSSIKVENDIEVVRFLIRKYYQENFEARNLTLKEELKRDKTLIDKFMEKYGDEWRQLGED